jgi:hypothetical protein
MRIVLLIAAAVSLGACVSTTYTKTIVVRTDASGRVLERTVTESIIQPNQTGYPVRFEYLKGVQAQE